MINVPIPSTIPPCPTKIHTCEYCKSRVDHDTMICPHCGAPIHIYNNKEKYNERISYSFTSR